MKNCSSCGSPLPDDAAFCPQCGQSAPAPEPASAPEPVPAAAWAEENTFEEETFNDLKTRVAPRQPRAPEPGITLTSGQIFHDRYTIEEKLGEGAMGVVYKAADKVTGRAVALKLISPMLVTSEQAVQRLIKEGLVSRDIRHPNTIAMHDVGQVDGQTYLVMEYVAGESLRRWLLRALKQNAESDAEIPYAIAWHLIRNILEGLEAAHAVGVIHRDLKPENIMLLGEPAAGDYRLKILDFGIARAVGGNAAANLTTTSAATGTAYYMAPEQKTAADTVTPAADLYAVTVMFYELLIGVPPEGRWRLPSEERSSLNAALDEVIETGLSNRPKSRYQSARAYIEALDRIPPAGQAALKPDRKPVKKPKKKPDHKQTGGGHQQPDNGGQGWWAARSGGQKAGIIIVSLLVLLAGVFSETDLPNGGDEAPPYPPPVSPVYQPPERQEPTPQPPREPPPAQIAGAWADQLEGDNFAQARVDLQQNGNQINGVVYLANGQQAGTLSGTIRGKVLTYRYRTNEGATGRGRGMLEADGRHISIEVTADDGDGDVQRHRLHLDHLPN